MPSVGSPSWTWNQREDYSDVQRPLPLVSGWQSSFGLVLKGHSLQISLLEQLSLNLAFLFPTGVLKSCSNKLLQVKLRDTLCVPQRTRLWACIQSFSIRNSVYLSLSVCAYTHTYTYVYIHVYRHVYMYKFMYTCMHMYAYEMCLLSASGILLIGTILMKNFQLGHFTINTQSLFNISPEFWKLRNQTIYDFNCYQNRNKGLI